MATRLSERKRIIREDDDEKHDGSAAKPGSASSATANNTASGGANPASKYRARREYNFSETSESLLAKYENEPPSIELHIYPTHYRFGNQEGVIPKNSPLIRMFFTYMEHEVIPPAATEVFRDSGIRFYEGCVIMQLIDHRNATVSSTGQLSQTQASAAVSTTSSAENGKEEVKSEPNSDNSAKDSTNNTTAAAAVKPDPMTYRTILRPTSLSLWHELLYTTDTSHGRFSDHLALSMEAEILALTIRNVDLRVPAVKQPPRSKPLSDIEDSAAAMKAIHNYRIGLSRANRPLHEDMVHHGSDYEELMLILDDKKDSAASTANGGQFMRLSFIEQIRKKRERLRALQQQRTQGAGTGAGAVGGPAGTAAALNANRANAIRAQQAGFKNGLIGGAANANNASGTAFNSNPAAATAAAAAASTAGNNANRVKLTQEQRVRYARYQIEENKKFQSLNPNKSATTVHMPYFVDQIPSHLVDYVLKNGRSDVKGAAYNSLQAPISSHPGSPVVQNAVNSGKVTKTTPKGKKAPAASIARPVTAGKSVPGATQKGRPKKTK